MNVEEMAARQPMSFQFKSWDILFLRSAFFVFLTLSVAALWKGHWVGGSLMSLLAFFGPSLIGVKTIQPDATYKELSKGIRIEHRDYPLLFEYELSKLSKATTRLAVLYFIFTFTMGITYNNGLLFSFLMAWIFYGGVYLLTIVHYFVFKKIYKNKSTS